MDQHGARLEATSRGGRKILGACFVGNFVEYYDFAVYGYTAGVIATLFFPEGNRVAAILATFALFALSFFMRPLGGIFFGNLGDRIGRRSVLSITILMMGASTVAVGLLPTYQQIGLLAPILLTVSRLVQGFSAGGEITGASTLAVENAPSNRRGTWIGIITLGTVISFTFAALTIWGLTLLMPAEAFAVWGWRLPFFVGGVIAVVGLYVRLSLEESPLFQHLVENREVASAPIVDLLKEYKKEVVLTFAISSFSGLSFYIIGTYFNSYLSEVLGLDPTTALLSTGLTLFLTSIIIALSGFIGDRVGRKPLLYTGAAWLALLSVPAFLLAGAADSLATALAAQLLLVPGLGMFVAGLIVILVEMFPTKVRYSGGALGYNVGYAIFGGTGPFVSAFLIAQTGSNVAPGVYIAVAAVIVLPIVIWGVPETFHQSLERESNSVGRKPRRA